MKEPFIVMALVPILISKVACREVEFNASSPGTLYRRACTSENEMKGVCNAGLSNILPIVVSESQEYAEHAISPYVFVSLNANIPASLRAAPIRPW